MYAVLLKIRHFSDLPYTFETVKFYNKNIVSVWLWFIVLEQFYNNNKKELIGIFLKCLKMI